MPKYSAYFALCAIISACAPSSTPSLTGIPSAPASATNIPISSTPTRVNVPLLSPSAKQFPITSGSRECLPSTRAIAVPDPEGPSFHQVLIAKSTDGLNWETDNRILIDQASVPEVVRFSDGRLGIYAVDGSGQGGPGYVYAESRDGGKTWTCGKMNFAGLGADPDIVWVAENTMRLYSVMFPFGPGQPPSPGQNTKPNSVNSAISTDGKNFSVEEGTRLEGVNYTDPDVIRVGNEWFMYVSTGPTAWAAKSNDGVKFELIGKVNETGAVSGSFVFPDGKIRHYYCANSGIESALSDTGGSVWKKEIGIRIPKAENVKIVCDPSIISDGKSGYWMVYKIQPK